MNNSTCSNPELRFKAAAELRACHSHPCPVCLKPWLHHDPEGKCLNRRDGSGRPSEMTCPECLRKQPVSCVGSLLDDSEDLWGAA